MPTNRPRHTVTETDAVARAIDLAARRWPRDAGARGRLLARLALLGADQIAVELGDQEARRRDVLAAIAGRFHDCFPPGYLARLREDWPA